MKVHSLYLSTLSPAPNAPVIDTTTIVAWNINWDSFFNSTKGEYCRVKFLLTSKSGVLVYNDTLCSLRASFTTKYANNYNGVNLGLLNATNDPTGADHRYLGDTTSSVGGVQISRPTGNQQFQLYFIGLNEVAISNSLDYQVWLYFEFDEEEK